MPVTEGLGLSLPKELLPAHICQSGVSPIATLTAEAVPTEVNIKMPFWKQNYSLIDRRGYQVFSCQGNCMAIQSASVHKLDLPVGQTSGCDTLVSAKKKGCVKRCEQKSRAPAASQLSLKHKYLFWKVIASVSESSSAAQ